MITSAVFVTTLIVLAVGILLLQECQFLIPYRHVLFMKYGGVVAGFAAALFVNLFAAVYMIGRAFFSKTQAASSRIWKGSCARGVWQTISAGDWTIEWTAKLARLIGKKSIGQEPTLSRPHVLLNALRATRSL